MELADLPELELEYECARDALSPALAARFGKLGCDAETRAFVLRARSAPHPKLATAAYRLLRRFVSDYDAYGLLGMYPMHLLSAAQFEALLGARAHDRGSPRRLLDVGAGNGDVTARAAPLFDRVTVTEASAVLRQRLRARGFAVLAHDFTRAPLPGAERFDAVLCLNVLDRCTRPRTLLTHLRAALAPGGTLLLSVPLPLSPHVQVGGRTVDPEELLPDASASWEDGATSLAREVLAPAALRVVRLARVPYLCRGDADRPLYMLDAALFACTAN